MTHLRQQGPTSPRVLWFEGGRCLGSSQFKQLCAQDIDAHYLNKDQEECTLKEKRHVEFDLLCHTSIDVPALITLQARQHRDSNIMCLFMVSHCLFVLTSVSVGLRSHGLLFKSYPRSHFQLSFFTQC